MSGERPAPDPNGVDDLAKYPEAGLHETLDFRIVERSDGRAVGELVIDRRHANRNGSLHGGVLSAMIDSVGSCAGLYCPYPGRIRRCMTISLTVNFTGIAREGRVRAVGTLVNAGRSSFTAAVEVRAENGNLAGHGIATYRYFRGSEKPEGEPIACDDDREA